MNTSSSNYMGKYCIDDIRFAADKKIFISGWILCDTEYKIRVALDDTSEVEITEKNQLREDVVSVFKEANAHCGFMEIIEVDETKVNQIKIQVLYNGEWLDLYCSSIIEIMKQSHFITHHIDSTILQKDKVVIEGWALTMRGDMPEIHVKGSCKHEVKLKERQDVYNAYHDNVKDKQLGFEIVIYRPLCSKLQIIYSVGDFSVNEYINIGKLKLQRTKERVHKVIKLIKILNYKKFIKGIAYLRKHGKNAFISKLKQEIDKTSQYNEWIYNTLPSEVELKKQEQHRFAYEPLISIVVPTYNTPKNFLRDMIQSVLDQSYQKWELCIADGNSQLPETIDLLKKYAAKEPRIKVRFLDENKGISGNTNECLEMACGEYIALFDHDDLLTPNALYEVVSVLNKDQTIDFIYSDEDKTDEMGQEYFGPHFKSDWAPDTLLSYNYICHFTVFRAALLEKVGKFNSEFDGSQDYDLFLRLTEQTSKIYHISKILYHWRVHRNSTAASLSAKEYTIEAARKALQAHLDRMGIQGKIEPGLIRGTHRVVYDIKGNPKISIIIPNKDHISDLKQCIDSIKKSTYTNYEIIIIENNSTEDETFTFYKAIEDETNIRVVVWKDIFNYSAINNFGAQYATGEYLILLNNDIEIISENWMEEMLMQCQREEVGIVGAKLYYPDDTIQHAGVIIGIGGVAGHSHKYYNRNQDGYFSRLKIIQNLSAVTAACLMVRRDVFESVNGLDEGFKVAFNDVDFCLRVRDQGKLVIYTPYVEAYHHESKSRGIEDTPEKIKRFQSEVERFYARWGAYRRDPYYNENLTLEKEDFGIKNL